MVGSTIEFTAFTKPWRDKPLSELAALMHEIGFDGIELPVRPGYQVTPETQAEGLPAAARILAEHGVRIASVAGNTDEATIAACGAAGVPMLRVMARIDLEAGYAASEKRLREEYDRLVPVLEAHGVTLGVQNHSGVMVGSAIGLMHLIEGYDPKHVAAVLDLAHCGLDGEPEAMAIDIAWSHLCMVNLKNAWRERDEEVNGDEVAWKVHWGSGREGFVSWRDTAAELTQRGYAGPVCLTLEYSRPEGGGQIMGDEVIERARADLAYAKALFT